MKRIALFLVIILVAFVQYNTLAQRKTNTGSTDPRTSGTGSTAPNTRTKPTPPNKDEKKVETETIKTDNETVIKVVTNNYPSIPGLDIIGKGYNVFGYYANQESINMYPIFSFGGNTETIMMGSESYSLPQLVSINNISKHTVETVSGSSLKSYSKELSAKVGLSVEYMAFSGSIQSSFGTSSSGSEEYFYMSLLDVSTKYKISLDTRDIDALIAKLDPKFKSDLENMAPEAFLLRYGSHFVTSAFLGGRADYDTKTKITSSTKTSDLSVAIEAKYAAVSGNAELKTSKSNSEEASKTTAKLKVTGGNSEYANNISDPETYNKWAEGIAKAPVLCDFDQESLTPIWLLTKDKSRSAALEQAFSKLCNKYPLPKEMVNVVNLKKKAYMLKNKASGSYYDGKTNNMVSTSSMDKQDFQRIFRIVNNERESGFVQFQNQLNAGNLNVSNEQLFVLELVEKEENTYYIKGKGGKYIGLSSNNTSLEQKNFSETDNALKWVLDEFNPENIVQPQNGLHTAIKISSQESYWDFDGVYPASGPGGLLLNKNNNMYADREIILTKEGEFFTLQPNSTNNGAVTITDGSKIEYKINTKNATQLFRFIYGGYPNTYSIVNKGGNAITADANNLQADGCIVTMQALTGGENQAWVLNPNVLTRGSLLQDGHYYIKAKNGNVYFDVKGYGGDTDKSGAIIQLWSLDSKYSPGDSKNGDRAIKFIPVGDGSFYIEFQNSSKKVLAVKGGGDNNGAQLVAMPMGGTETHWRLEKDNDSNDFYYIVSQKSGKAVDATGGSQNHGTNLQQYDRKVHKAQQWEIVQ